VEALVLDYNVTLKESVEQLKNSPDHFLMLAFDAYFPTSKTLEEAGALKY
jgi:hypothetical protein